MSTSSSSRLCERCQEILSVGPDEDSTDKGHHVDSETFFQAVEQGCYICKWVWRSTRWSPTDGYKVYAPVHHTKYRWNKSTDLRVQYSCDMWQLYITPYETEFHLYNFVGFVCLESSIEGNLPLHIHDLRLKDAAVRTNLVQSIRSEETFSLARQWIKECRSGHSECRVSTDGRKLPTRPICVQPTSTGSKLLAKICRGDILPIETTYLTLSHCWGDVKFLTTTRANLSSFELSLPIERLSGTFKDAFFATVNLGFQYIWIDSLCIVQDDSEDWKRESSLMHEVYKNASCNVSASGFANGREGFILNKRSIDPSPLLVRLRTRSSIMEYSALHNDHGKTYYLMHSDPWDGINKGPIFLRAWTLQEQLLAPRAVHFSEDQVHWECKRTVVNEVWPRGWLNTPLEHVNIRSMNSPWRLKIEDALTDKSTIYRTWAEIVSNYSRRHLTFASDRLPALAGIANEFRSYLGDENVYGLWTRDIHRGILFRQLGGVFAPSNSIVMPTWQDSPSWSWAALHKPVSWDLIMFSNKVDYLCDIDLLRLPEIVKLRLCGMLMQCPSNYSWLSTGGLAWTLGDRRIQGSDNSGFLLRFYPDQWFDSTFDEWAQWQPEVTPAPTETEIDDMQSERVLKAFLESIVIMPILFHAEADTRNGIVSCLVLQPQLRPERGVYKRAGVMEALKSDREIFDCGTAKLQLKAHQGALDHHLFQEVDDDGNYTITVS